MKRVLIPFAFLFLTACFSPPATILPAETAAALTLAAMPPATTTSPGKAEETLVPLPPSITPTLPTDFDSNAPGAYCIPTDTERKRALVSRVIDGDTIEVSVDNYPYKVKYIGVDAPGVAPEVEWQAEAIRGGIGPGPDRSLTGRPPSHRSKAVL